MKRRHFFQTIAAAGLGTQLGVGATVRAAASVPVTARVGARPVFALDANRVRFFGYGSEALKVMVVADTHLFRDDPRGEPLVEYSGRMARAYNQTRHFQTGEPTDPERSFVATLELARKSGVDLVALVGDIFSFPAEAAVEWAQARLAEAGLPYLYVAGNHDWHYEGMPGTMETLRATWIRERLLPLYQGQDPLMAVREVRGIRFLALDNSTYEILPDQLEFFRAEAKTGRPLVLLVHIPLYAPGRPVGFGCGHPEWGAKTDRNYEVERRPRWPESGHTAVTLAFHREVFATSNLVGIFAGHMHRPSLDVWNGVPQFVTDANATGAFLSVEFDSTGWRTGAAATL